MSREGGFQKVMVKRILRAMIIVKDGAEGGVMNGGRGGAVDTLGREVTRASISESGASTGTSVDDVLETESFGRKQRLGGKGFGRDESRQASELRQGEWKIKEDESVYKIKERSIYTKLLHEEQKTDSGTGLLRSKQGLPAAEGDLLITSNKHMAIPCVRATKFKSSFLHIPEPKAMTGEQGNSLYMGLGSRVGVEESRTSNEEPGISEDEMAHKALEEEIGGGVL
ncbi:hypothetical protein EV426DRAFT_716516 [Tirmania nivea]|nr:hypothetical protein EV426DRAFT_716516 [Tirmania nivea]